MADTKYIVFTLGEYRYCMRLAVINGIEQSYNIIPVPMGADYIKGIIHLREQIVPVYDLKAKFGIDSNTSDNGQLLVTETHGIRLGFEVDMVCGIVSVSEDDIKPAPDVVLSEETGYLENVVNIKLPDEYKSDIMISVSVDNIMSESDFTSVSDALEEKKKSED